LVTYRDVHAIVTKRPGPWALDLFCKAGGAAAGYARAGFQVIGVDKDPQPRFPYTFLQADALEFLAAGGAQGFAFVHASPPCQAFSVLSRNLGYADRHPDLIEATRALLRATGLPYIIENVPGAPLVEPVMVCGSSLGLNLRRHRLFESNVPLMAPPCAHGWQTPRFTPASNRTNLACVVNIYGAGSDVALWRETFDTPWMTRDEIAQAIPPAYTELLGGQVLAQMAARAES
jgi:DNA (cytosine-5)-methyltransferase 1